MGECATTLRGEKSTTVKENTVRSFFLSVVIICIAPGLDLRPKVETNCCKETRTCSLLPFLVNTNLSADKHLRVTGV